MSQLIIIPSALCVCHVERLSRLPKAITCMTRVAAPLLVNHIIFIPFTNYPYVHKWFAVRRGIKYHMSVKLLLTFFMKSIKGFFIDITVLRVNISILILTITYREVIECKMAKYRDYPVIPFGGSNSFCIYSTILCNRTKRLWDWYEV